MAVRDDDGVDVAHDLLGGEGQRHGRVRNRVAGALDRRPRAGVVEHRIDEDSAPRELEDERRVANERQPHGRVSTSEARIDAWPGFALHPAILRDPMANDIAEKPAAAEEGVWTTGPTGS